MNYYKTKNLNMLYPNELFWRRCFYSQSTNILLEIEYNDITYNYDINANLITKILNKPWYIVYEKNLRSL